MRLLRNRFDEMQDEADEDEHVRLAQPVGPDDSAYEMESDGDGAEMTYFELNIDGENPNVKEEDFSDLEDADDAEHAVTDPYEV